MIEAYKIGVSLTLAGDAHKKMTAFAAMVKKASDAVQSLYAHMRPLSTSFTTLNSTLSSSIERTDALATKTEVLKKSLDGVTRSALEAGLALNSGGGGGGGRRGHGGNRLAHMFGHEAGGGALGGVLSGMAFGGASSGLLIGAIGTAMLVKAGFNANSKFQQAVAQYSQQGFGDTATQQAVNFAMHTPIPGISKIDLMHAITDAITVTRNPAGALVLAPEMAKMEFANQQIYTQQGRKFTRQDELRMAQFAELRTGSTDPALILKALNQIEQAYASDAARLSTNDLRTFGRQGASFLHNLSDKDFAGMLPLIQSLGGQRVATGFTTMQNSLFKGQNMRTGKRAQVEFERLGIFKNGKLDPALASQLTHDPLDFIYQTLIPAMSSKGITTPAQQSQELGILFTQSVTRVIQQAIAQKSRVMAQEALVPSAGGIESNFAKAINMPTGQVASVSAAWSNMALAFGQLTAPATTGGMKSLISFLNALTNIFNFINAAGSATAYGIRKGIFAPFDQSKSAVWGGVKTLGRKLLNDAEQNININIHNSWDAQQATTAILRNINDNGALAQNSMPSQFTPGLTSISNPFSGNH